MAQVMGQLDVVLYRAAVNLRRRGAEADNEGRLEAVLAAIRFFPSSAAAIARELGGWGFDLGSESRASPRSLAEALLELLMRPDVSEQYGLCDLWSRADADSN